MNLPISVLAVLCLSSFGRAQICDPTNMDFHCRGWKKANDSLGAGAPTSMQPRGARAQAL